MNNNSLDLEDSSFMDAPLKAPIKTVQPPKATGLNIPQYHFEWAPPETGAYGSFLNSCGQFFGTMGLIPCCFCANKYKEVDQGSVGLITRFGKLYKGVDPGLVEVNIITEKLHRVSVLLNIKEIPSQSCMTKDNVNISLSSVLYYKIVEPAKSVFEISDLATALSERTQTTLRHVVGARSLQDVIEKREEVALAIEEIISDTAASWGVSIESILIKDIVMPASVENSLSKAAEAKRIGESKIIAARAEVESAKLMRKAADILSSKAAMQIRYLDAMMNMAKSSNSKVIFMPGSGDVEGMTPTLQQLDNKDTIVEQPTGYDTNTVALQEAIRQ